MTPTEVTAILRKFNDWRRGHHDDAAQPDPREIGEAIDAAIEMIERLESAESCGLEQARLNGMGSEREAALMAKLEAAEKTKSDWLRANAPGGWIDDLRVKHDALRAAVRHEADCVEAAMAEIKSLRAKIAEMERQKQEPVAWLHETRRDSDVVTDAVKHVWGKAAVGSMAAYSIPLYLAPGAKGE